MTNSTHNIFLMIQVYTGSYRHPGTQVTESDLSQLHVGHLVAVIVENCDDELLIGKVLEVFDDDISIVWMQGEYTTTWKTARQIDPRNRRKKIDWTDIIPKASVLLFAFEFTSTNRLRKTTVEHLKKKYATYNSSSKYTLYYHH